MGERRRRGGSKFLTPPGRVRSNLPLESGGRTLATRTKRKKRNIEKDDSPRQLVAKLRRLADCIEQGQRFRIQIAGERVSIPPDATIHIEHERSRDEEEIEFQLQWCLED